MKKLLIILMVGISTTMIGCVSEKDEELTKKVEELTVQVQELKKQVEEAETQESDKKVEEKEQEQEKEESYKDDTDWSATDDYSYDVNEDNKNSNNIVIHIINYCTNYSK